MKFENIRVYNFENALRGMRNPKESYLLSDSTFGLDNLENISKIINNMYSSDEDKIRKFLDHILYSNNGFVEYAFIGENDMRLAKNLIKAGSEHRKFLRQIFVTVDITAPLYWWKEFDTYKVGTVANSTSTMHTIQKQPITIECFEIDDYEPRLDLFDENLYEDNLLNPQIGIRTACLIDDLEQLREKYLETQDKKYWKELIRWLPESWLQKRTVTMNYENLLGMCSVGQRRFHKLTEWSSSFIDFARQLPYAQDFIFIDEE